MSRSSEEVLLIISNVRNKKTDGTLYLMGERLAWMQDSKKSFSISHLYADIKLQKISPDTKEKIQLQLQMHDGSANTFHFNNSKGRQAQIQDRDSCKELLQQLLPKFKQKISSELEQKNRLLQEDPQLFQLYKDLVVSGVVSAEEFWESKSKIFQSNSKTNDKQTIGISAAFLADIKPQTDGCNGLKYNLTADIIESIFKTYPMVKKKHADYVPHHMTESEFWTRFFQSHYFHRDRINFGSKDLFAECAKTDEQEMQVEIQTKIQNPLLDLTVSDNSLDEDYRGAVDDKRLSTNHTNLSLIKRFNHHSTMVLKACEKQTGELTQSNSNCDNSKNTSDKQLSECAKVMNGECSTTKSSDVSDEPVCKKIKLKEKVTYEDLEERTNTDLVNLRLDKLDRYLQGPTPITASKYTTSDEVLDASHAVCSEVGSWSPHLSQVLPGSAAAGVLGELAPGGVLMHGSSEQQLEQLIQKDIQEEVRQLYCALCELLRHFWSCFPTVSKFLEEKVVKMRSTLDRFHAAKLNPLKDKLSQYHYNIDMTCHMEEMLNSAFAKYESWHMKRMSKKS